MIAHLLALCMPLSPAPPVPLQDTEPAPPTTFREALFSGRTWLDLNYRVEGAEQDTLGKNAYASTLRTALGYETATFRSFRGMIEFEDISNIGNQLYNSTTNGNTDRPVVADPDSTEINQVYATYAPDESLEFKLGRQEITFGSHRFIGNVGWRQNHQSFDAARADWTTTDGTQIRYAYVDSVRRIFGENSPKGMEKMGSHLLDIRRRISGLGDFAAYGYFLDFDRSQTLSSLTLGARISGKKDLSEQFDLLYTAEFARQEDAGHNPIDINADYWLTEIGLDFGPAALRIGNEHLGGSGQAGDKFSTPLATLHKFNGFADVFLTTPDTGLEDRYLTVTGKIGQVACSATYHIFQSDSGDIDYGKELDLTALYPLNERTKIGGKLAHFTSDDAYTDIDRAMAWIHYRVL